MFKKMLSLGLACVVALTMGTVAFAAPVRVEEKDTVWIAPSTETMINGQPEGSMITPRDVIIGPYFYSYAYNVKTQVDKFRVIGKFTHSNKLGTSVDPMNVTVTNSTSQGSEWSGSIQFTGEIKAGILGEIKAQGGGSYKSSRVTNEAVGYSVSHEVAPGKIGHIDLYYRGYKIGGKLTTWTAFTGDMEGSKRYSTQDVYATLYPSDYLDIYSESYDSY